MGDDWAPIGSVPQVQLYAAAAEAEDAAIGSHTRLGGQLVA